MRATYRLQLGPDTGFARARELVPYLRDLGVSHLHLSPALQARRGSTHGYDVTDPRRMSEDLGGEAAFRELAGAGLDVLLDIVPNHMAASDENPFWADKGLWARFFDIDPETGRHRRFFSIDELAGVRQEDPEVFETTHALVLRLVAEGVVDGLRIDHPDGLADPPEYLRRLAARGVDRVWVEKILEPGEELPEWPVEGTTGYEFMADATALFVDPAGEGPLTALYAELTGERRPFAQVAAEAKLREARTTFRPEVERLRTLLDEPDMAGAVAGLPVYRTYVEPSAGQVEPHDIEAVEEADLPERVREALVAPSDPDEEAFASRFQQTTGPSWPRVSRTPPSTATCAWPRSTRSAPTPAAGARRRPRSRRATRRAAAASRVACSPPRRTTPSARATCGRGSGRCRGCPAPGASGSCAGGARTPRCAPPAGRTGEEYLIYQTLVGAWPLERERLVDYMVKAMREAKLTTDWVDPDEDHERAVRRFIGGLYRSESFLADLEAFVAEVAPHGEAAALGQTLLKLTAPGVPDLYQGDELWCLSLVDPDNGRPVDWERRRHLLDGLLAGTPPARETAKLFLIHRALAPRARRSEAFAGSYRALDAGEGAFAYARGDA
ncbi:MAG TPA: alpha-amylase family glycosyl hydrolase [Miltoncostaeaceae bacterium]|nr:alpha-amylase family glycosyl hydrolase [Miltoncostaeaceae bacterium]